MDGQDIIDLANSLIDDDLDPDLGLTLLNQAYHEWQNKKQWEVLKKSHSATQSVSVDYIALPTDFRELVIPRGRDFPIIYIGSDYEEEYGVISFDRRRDFKDSTGYAYLDMRQDRLVFTLQPPSAKAISFDYIYVPADLTVSTEPVFPERFREWLAYRMAVLFYATDETEKGRSYRPEHKEEADGIMQDMLMWDAQLKQSAQ